MSLQLAKRISKIKESATLAISAKAKEMKEQGIDIMSLSAGEPDFNTPEHILVAARNAMDRGETKYTAVGGTPKLKNAIIAKLLRDQKLEYKPSEVIVSCGAKHSIYNIFMALLDEGDEVIVPSPYWVSYPEQVKLSGARTVTPLCSSDDNYCLKADALEAAISPKTKLLILNSPSNPTGFAYGKEDLLALGEVLLRHPHVFVLCDDIYEHILYDERSFYNLPMLFPELKQRCFLVNGVSKAYSMTGWRIGYCAGPAALMAAIGKIQGQSTSNPSSISQEAAYAALEGSQGCVAEMRSAFSKRRDLIWDLLQQASPANLRIKSFLPKGPFTFFQM